MFWVLEPGAEPVPSTEPLSITEVEDKNLKSYLISSEEMVVSQVEYHCSEESHISDFMC